MLGLIFIAWLAKFHSNAVAILKVSLAFALNFSPLEPAFTNLLSKFSAALTFS